MHVLSIVLQWFADSSRFVTAACLRFDNETLLYCPAAELENYKQLVENLEIEKASMRHSLNEATSVIDSARVLLTENLRLSKQVCDVIVLSITGSYQNTNAIMHNWMNTLLHSTVVLLFFQGIGLYIKHTSTSA